MQTKFLHILQSGVESCGSVMERKNYPPPKSWLRLSESRARARRLPWACPGSNLMEPGHVQGRFVPIHRQQIIV